MSTLILAQCPPRFETGYAPIYCISCRRCPQLYIGETGRTLHERFGEHLRSVKKTRVVSQSQSTLTRPVIVYQTLLLEA